MNAGDKVIWKANDGQKCMCKIVAIFKVEDSVNKKEVGEMCYKIDFNGEILHVSINDIEPMA